MIKYILTGNKADCCGCKACEQICAHHTLSLQEDEEGFLYPVLDESVCVNCGLCEKVCPMSYGEELLHENGKILAAQNKDGKDLSTSSSGGGFVAIAKEILNLGGVVYGAAFEDGPVLCHQRVTTVDDLEKLKGSKYLQSDVRDTYKQVKADLLDNRYVYFVGTPCQIAGLRLFLRKDYEKLLTSDLVCHGTPSNKIFNIVVDHIGQKVKGKLKNYSFRDKRVRGWSCSSSSSWEKGGREVSLIYSKDMEAYFNAFISGELMRMSCYSCPYARFERCGDITLADYWGVRQNHPNFPKIGKGVSLLIINSTKGKALLDRIADKFHLEPISKEVAVTSNDNLVRPSVLKPGRKNSYQLIMSDYNQFIDKYYEGNYLKNKIRVYIEYYIRKYPFLFSVISFLKKKTS